MFSPVKAIVAGALTFALLGVLSIAQPFDQQGATVPGAPVASPSPVSAGRAGGQSRPCHRLPV